jgi:hypothetical protein
VVPPAGWNVEFWNPAGTTTNRVSSVNPTGAPDDGLDLFASEFAVQNGDENPPWQPNWGGLHFYWTGQARTPIQTNAILDFSLFLNTSAFGLDSNRLFATVVGQESNEIDYFSVIGGPVALPQQAADLSVAPDGTLTRTGNIFSVVLQILNAGGSQANDVTITSVAPMAPVTYLGSLRL